MSTSQDFIGTGFAGPFRVDHRGSIALSTGGESVDEAIRMIVLTAPGERPFRPAFGCEIWSLLFAPLNPSTFGLMAFAVREAVGQWEPRAQVEDVSVRPSASVAGAVEIDVTYRLATTNDKRNLVFPFYVIPEEHADNLLVEGTRP